MEGSPSDLFSFTLESSRNPITDAIDPDLLFVKSLIVPGNSGIQIIWSKIKHAMNRAKRFKEPFRSYAIDMVMAYIEGVASISSEHGSYVKEFATIRSKFPIGDNQGQPYNWMDQWYHEDFKGDKGALKNNKFEAGTGLDLS